MANYTNSVGVDVSKQHLDVYHGTTGELFRVGNTRAGIKKIISWLSETDEPVIIIEPSGGYELDLQSELLSQGFGVAKVNAIRIRQFARSAGQLSKTDAADAKVLALYGQKLEPRTMVIVTRDQEYLSGLVTRRRQLVDTLSAEKNRLAKARHDYATQSIQESMAYLKKQLNAIDERIADMIQKSESLSPAFKLVTGITGIGKVAGAVLLAELPELGHIGNKQISSLVGVAPYNYDSGTIKGKRSIYGGRHTVRCALYLVTLTAIRYDENIKAFYQNLKQQGKPSKVAIVACMRKIIVITNAKLRDFYAENA